MRGLTRSVATLLAVSTLVAVGAATVGAKGKAKGKKDSATVYLAITHQAKGSLLAAGNVYDKLLGTGAVAYKAKATPTPTGAVKVSISKVTEFTGTGSLTGKASATLTVTDSKGDATITGGKFSLTKGAGSQKGHSYTGTFKGTGNANTGLYTFQLKGAYK
jgi:hypothetical protein